MSLPSTFQKTIRAVQTRCSLNRLLHEAVRVWAASGVVAALAVLTDRLTAIRVFTPWILWMLLGAAVGTVLVLWLLQRPTRMQVCLLLDERLGLRERFTTTLVLARSDDPFARAARAESLDAIRQADLRGRFPISLPRTWPRGAVAWTMTLLLALLLPQRDLLGLLRDRQARQQDALAVQGAQTEVRRVAESVHAAVRAMGDPNLTASLERLDDLEGSTDPRAVKREAIRALGDLADRIKQMQAGSRVQSADVLGQMLRQLRGSPDAFSQQLRMALAQGRFAQASDLLAEVQGQLHEGSLQGQSREELTARLQELANELQSLAEQGRWTEGDLARLGLDPRLARAGPEALRLALQDRGLDPAQIDQIQGRVEAGQGASALCSGLGQSLGAAVGGNGLSADGLSGVLDELNALDALQQQVYALQAGLAEISNGLYGLGEGLRDGDGQGPQRFGLSPGSHEVTSDPLTATRIAKAPSRPDSTHAQPVATWTFRDVQVRGEARRAFAEVVQAARAGAAEAITENRIPRRYEDAVKAYFDRLEENGTRP